MKQLFRIQALNKKLIAAEHAWEVIGLGQAAWKESERLGLSDLASWELCEKLHERYKIVATPDLLSQRTARALLQALEQRRLARLASPRQVYYLREYGVGDETTTAKEAEKLLTELWGQQRAERQRQERTQLEGRSYRAEKPDDWVQHLIDGAPDTHAGGSGPARFFDLDDD